VKISRFSIRHDGNSDEMLFAKDKTETICNHSSGVICLHYQEFKKNSEGYLFSGGGKAELFLTKMYLEGELIKIFNSVPTQPVYMILNKFFNKL